MAMTPLRAQRNQRRFFALAKAGSPRTSLSPDTRVLNAAQSGLLSENAFQAGDAALDFVGVESGITHHQALPALLALIEARERAEDDTFGLGLFTDFLIVGVVG